VPKDKIAVIQFFVMALLGCTCPIEDKVGHDFDAFAFGHLTSCCVVLQDGLVQWKNDGGL
jgi:hypothetical protein